MKKPLTGIVFIDSEISAGDNDARTSRSEVLDIGAVTGDGKEFHSNSLTGFSEFISHSEYICGHNIVHHDLKYLGLAVPAGNDIKYIDTLYISPLLFPKKPYHKLVKDDKLVSDELNNPLSDAKKARELFFDEIAAFSILNKRIKSIYAGLLSRECEFEGFFHYADAVGDMPGTDLIREEFAGNICTNAPLDKLAAKYPVELAYALAQVSVIKDDSLTPSWVLRNYPRVENTIRYLRNRNCGSCPYCLNNLDAKKALNRWFHFDSFRSYDGEPLQETAVKAAIDGKSILVVFPTGGGKSMTFQLPALMAGENEKGLTVVISPLQSLMKDQTDSLEAEHDITGAVTINGSLGPIERKEAIERVENGTASMLYIAPESLRSRTIETLLQKRNVVRFVIDEAHCFSTWGQDFRVDYLYIGDFIKRIKERKSMPQDIPVSCFTATAKQKVISDICDYFRDKLSLELEVFRASTARKNLKFHILGEKSDDEKLLTMRQLLYDNDCPAIIYAARVKKTEELALALTGAGIPAKAYNGKMDKELRSAVQDEFMSGELRTIVATTAFGMGVDKKDVGMVIHYDISPSVEDYVQEAGRAGRDEQMDADCYILYGEDDLDKHFIMLNQSKVTQKEIRQIWKALKDLSKFRDSISGSALEIARAAGWDDSIKDLENRVRTAINALEQSGFIKREQNMPRVYADGILVKNMEEAALIIERSARFGDKSREHAKRIMSSLISAKRKAAGRGEDGESYVDYISDRLGIDKADVIRVIGLLREESILADSKDLVAFIKKKEKQQPLESKLKIYRHVEDFLLGYLKDYEDTYNIKELNEAMQAIYPEASIDKLQTVINYYDIKRMINRTREYSSNYVTLKPLVPLPAIREESGKRHRIAEVIISYLFTKVTETEQTDSGKTAISNTSGTDNARIIVEFSVLELKDVYAHNLFGESADTLEIENALLYLSRIGAIRIDGGFLVLYNAMRIDRLEKNNRATYNKEHYALLEDFYLNKRQQIHIVGEYAKRLIEDYRDAMTFVDDYFVMHYDMFLHKYFEGRGNEINRNITPSRFKKLFGELSTAQLRIIKNTDSRFIVVAAGPGSGKTKLLTHKLASLCIMEDIRYEQLLMLTFSRAAATEFKLRLKQLIGNAANFIQIMTFHSYCFDLLGRVGDLEKSDSIIEQAVEKINASDIDVSRIIKTVLVIDEAQDMSAAEYSLVRTLIEKNDGLRVIAVGDDDQNIYEFRKSSSEYFKSLQNERNSKKYELLENYRSASNIVEFANSFAARIDNRMKSAPIVPVKTEDGTINICKLTSKHAATAVVNAVLDFKLSGTTCIATRTNEEAFNIAGLLLKEKISARLIQENRNINLYNLAEFRDFVEYIEKADDNHIISTPLWQNAIAALNRKYCISLNLPGVSKLLREFENISGNTMYKSDLKQYIRESRLEDLESGSGSTVLVSTIHQTKGREFDNVFLVYTGNTYYNDERERNAKMREVYVALTRARQNLYIFCNNNYFDGINAPGVIRTTDDTDYPAPPLICLQLTHKDVVLSYFKYRRRETGSLISGNELIITDTGCTAGDTQVLKFSEKFRQQLSQLQDKGYNPVRAYVRHIVYWQGEDMTGEIKIVLPNIELSK